MQSPIQRKCVFFFACGVILYWGLLAGHLLFEKVNAHRLAGRIKRVEYDFNHAVWKDVSELAKDLVSQFL